MNNRSSEIEDDNELDASSTGTGGEHHLHGHHRLSVNSASNALSSTSNDNNSQEINVNSLEDPITGPNAKSPIAASILIDDNKNDIG